MEQAKRRKIEMIAGLVLVVLAFLGNCNAFILTLKSGSGVGLSATAFTFLALIMAGVYVSTEFKKSSAKLYKLFLGSFALKLLTGVLVLVEAKSSLYIIISVILAFALVNVLLWTNNLGKMASIVLSSCVFVEGLCMFIYRDIISPSGFGADATLGFESLSVIFAQLSLSLVLVMMVHLKYVDKEMRKGKNT